MVGNITATDMVITEPYSPNKDLIDAIDAQLESIRKLLSMLRNNMCASDVIAPKIVYTTNAPYFTPEDLKTTKITCAGSDDVTSESKEPKSYWSETKPVQY